MVVKLIRRPKKLGVSDLNLDWGDIFYKINFLQYFKIY